MKRFLLKPLVKNKNLKSGLRFLFALEILLLILISLIVSTTLLSYRTVEKWDISVAKNQVKEFDDSSFIKDKTYIIKGTDGINANISVSLKIKGYELNINSYSLKIDPVDDIKYKGSTELSTIEDKLKTDFNNSIDNLKVDNKEKLTNISFKNIELNADDSFIVKDNQINVGKFFTNLNNCNFEAGANIVYSLDSKTFSLDIGDEYLNSLCVKYTVPDNPI